MSHYSFTQRAFNVRNVSDIHLCSSLRFSPAFQYIYFIWKPAENPRAIHFKWPEAGHRVRPLCQCVDPHHAVLFLISARFSLLNSLFLSSQSCRRPLVLRAHILSHPRLKGLLFFYSAVVNALACCDLDCNFLRISRSS